MNIGEQSVLNDLIEVEARLSAVEGFQVSDSALEIIVTEDWNQALNTGFYKNIYVTALNGPTEQYYIGEVVRHSASHLVQRVTEYGYTALSNKVESYERRRVDGVWTGWYLIYNSSNTITDANGFIKAA